MKILKISILAIFTMGLSHTYAQDIITLKTGDDIEAKVEEISSTEIKYKRFDNLQGPTVVLSKSEIFSIKYENGTKEVFTASDNPASKNPTVTNKEAGTNECTIIVYRKSKAIPVILKALVVDVVRTETNKKLIGMYDGKYYKCIVSDLGKCELIAGVKKQSKPVKLNLEAGKTYYVSCWAKDDVFFKYGAGIELVDEKQALIDLAELEEIEY